MPYTVIMAQKKHPQLDPAAHILQKLRWMMIRWLTLTRGPLHWQIYWHPRKKNSPGNNCSCLRKPRTIKSMVERQISFRIWNLKRKRIHPTSLNVILDQMLIKFRRLSNWHRINLGMCLRRSVVLISHFRYQLECRISGVICSSASTSKRGGKISP